MFQCRACSRLWHDANAEENAFRCFHRCGGPLDSVPPLALSVLEGIDLARLPYPIALTAGRLDEALHTSADVLKTLFLLKDTAEAAIKFLGSVLLVEYLRSPACTPARNAGLLERLIRPTLGMWVNDVVRPISLWLAETGNDRDLGSQVAALFAEPASKAGGNPSETDLFRLCNQFVSYRNDALGHGARRRDAQYETDLRDWLPLVCPLLAGLAGLAPWRLGLVADVDLAQVWMGPHPGTAIEPGVFVRAQAGHFVLRGPERQVRDLFPFVCCLPVAGQQPRLHFYDALHRYKATGKEVLALEYDEGFKQARPEPIAGLEEAFTTELLAEKFGRHRGRMEVIEGRVAGFGALIDEHAAIVGRRFVIDHVARFVRDHDRGLLVIEAEPGKGKTALLAHLVDAVYGHVSPQPVHFFYRRTAAITDPDVCVRSLYHALLDAHNLTEAEESQRQTDPESMYHKLANLLTDQVAPRLTPGRPQWIFIDALDESQPTPTGRTALHRIPEDLPAGVYIVATTRPVADRVTLARRPFLHWFNLENPDYLQHNLNDGQNYAERELVHSPLAPAAIAAVARVAAGNFLVLTLLCRHIRTDLSPWDVSGFLHRLATDGAEDKLGFIYAEFWNRITARLTRADLSVLCDVAGVLVAARGPLTANLVSGVLNLRAGDWDFALRQLREYLTVQRSEQGTENENFYRIYHESFADFLRARTAIDRPRHRQHLGDYALHWSRHEGYGRLYSLRFGPRQLLEDERWEDLTRLLLDIFFLEAKAEADLVYELVADLGDSARRMPPAHPMKRILGLLDQVLRHDIQFVARHPAALFQCFWNRGWWYDCPDSALRYGPPPGGWPPEGAPWERAEARLCSLLERWRQAKEQRTPGFVWVRSMRPPQVPLGNPLQAVFRGHEGWVRCVAFAPEGRRIVSGSSDRTVRVWDADTGAQLAQFDGHERGVMSVAFAPDGRRIVSASDNLVRVWDAETGAQLARLNGHENRVTSVAFAPDGRRIVSGSNDGTLRVWDAETGVQLARLDGHDYWVTCVAFAPDGRLIVSASSDNSMRVWDADTGVQLIRLDGHENWVVSVAFAPDGQRIASGSHDNTVRVWDAETGVQLARFDGHEKEVTSVAFAPDGRRVVSGSLDRTVRVCNAETGAQLARLDGHENRVGSVAFCPDGRRIVSASDDRSMRVWDADSGPQLAWRDRHEGWISSVAFAPDGRHIASGSWDKTVRLWHAETGAQVAKLARLDGHESIVTSVASSPDGRRIVSGSIDRTVRIWDIETGAVLARLDRHESWVTSVAFAPDGRRIVSGSCDKTLRLWDAETGAQLARIVGHENAVWSVAFAPGGRRIVSGSNDNTIRIWDAETGVQLVRLDGHESCVTSVAFAPDGRRIVSGSWDKTVRVWDGETGAQLALLDGHEGVVMSVAFASDGHRIVSGSKDRTVRIWDTETGAPLARLEGHESWVHSVAFAPDGRRIISGSVDRSIRVWDVETGVQLARLDGHEDEVWSVALAPDGRRIVSGSSDKTVRVWDADTGAQLARLVRLDGHEGVVTSVGFSPDGRRIVSGSNDRTVRVWDTATGRAITRLDGHESWVTSVGFASDGRRIVSGSCDKTVRVWDAETSSELARLDGHEDEVWCAAFAPDGRRVISGSSDKTVRIWDAETGAQLARLDGHRKRIVCVAYAPDRRHIVSGSDDQTVRVWDAGSGVCLDVIEGRGDIKAIAAGARAHSFQAIVRGLETIIETSADGVAVAWFPASLDHLTTHPFALIWAGSFAKHLELFRLEGAVS